jgi:N-glycosylase/DNA lyase
MTRAEGRAEQLRREHAERGEAIRKRLREFAAVPESEWFYELVYCLLTPQSSAVNAALAVKEIRSAGSAGDPLRTSGILRDPAHYIRFHRTKAMRIAEAEALYPSLLDLLRARRPGEELRSWLVAHVRGLGWKESSHFLRNIGYRDLAILDRHILRNLKIHGAIRTVPTTLTPKRYLAIEGAFRRFALRTGIDLDELDLLFWSRETGEILK